MRQKRQMSEMRQRVTTSYLKRRDAGWAAIVAAAQGSWHTPDEFLARIVRRATGADLARHERILAGLTNWGRSGRTSLERLATG